MSKFPLTNNYLYDANKKFTWRQTTSAFPIYGNKIQMDESICGTARKIRKKNKTNKKREKQPNVFLHPVDDRMPKKGNPITKNRS